jgi:8-oxo-dGTP pyrophosphatase MutT (NUDIX family)
MSEHESRHLRLVTEPAPEAVPIAPEIADHIALLTADAHEKKEYRPVGVAIIQDTQGRFLFVQSAKNPNDWWFPQGGVEPGEDATQTVIREAQEETGIAPEHLTLVDFFGSQDLDAESGRADKRGFTKGKRYLFFHLAYRGEDDLTLQESEVSDHQWVPIESIPERLETTRPEKTQMLGKLALT